MVRTYQDMMHGHDFCIYRRGTLTRTAATFLDLVLFSSFLYNQEYHIKNYRNLPKLRGFGVSEFRSFGVSDHIGLRT